MRVKSCLSFGVSVATIRMPVHHPRMSRTDYRSEQREALAVIRMSVEEKAMLKAEAARAGLSLQQLFELRLLGAAKPRPRDGRRPNGPRPDLPLAS